MPIDRTPEQRRADIMSRIRTLLALADDKGATESERDAARERATRLMAAHDLEDITAQDGRPVYNPDDYQWRSFTFEGGFCGQKLVLAHSIAIYLGLADEQIPVYTRNANGSLIWRKGNPQVRSDARVVRYFGTAGMTEFAELLFTTIVFQAENDRRAATLAGLTKREVSGVAPAVWHSNFYWGFVNAVTARLDNMRLDREEDTSEEAGTALVLFNLVGRAYEEATGKSLEKNHKGVNTKSNASYDKASRTHGRIRGTMADVTAGRNNVRNTTSAAQLPR